MKIFSKFEIDSAVPWVEEAGLRYQQGSAVELDFSVT